MEAAIKAVFSEELGKVEEDAVGVRKPMKHDLIPEVEGAVLHHNVFTPAECQVLLTAISEIHQHANSKRTDTAKIRRDSQHHIPHHVSNELMAAVSERLRPLLPSHAAQDLPLAPVGRDVSSFFRTYFYEAGDTSKPHYDRSFTERGEDGQITHFSAYSILIYLGPDICEGGHTTFFKHNPHTAFSRNRLTPLGNDRSVLQVNVSVQPTTGSVLVFPHGEYIGCAANPLHEGSVVVSGTKGLIRTDAVYVGTPVHRSSALGMAPQGEGGNKGSQTKSKKEKKQERKRKEPPRQVKRIYDVLVEAAAAVCPSVDPSTDLDCTRVVKLTGRRAGPEILCSFGTVAYWALYRMEQQEEQRQKQQKKLESQGQESTVTKTENTQNKSSETVWTSGEIQQPPPSPSAPKPKKAKRSKEAATSQVTVVSSMGTVRALSPVQLTTALLDAIPADVREELMPFARIDPEGGVIAINTSEFIAQNISQGLVVCQLCGAFVKAHTSGLTWHMKSTHGLNNHHDASAAVAVSEQALMSIQPLPAYRTGENADGDAYMRQAELNTDDLAKAQADPAVLAAMVSAGRVKPLSAPMDACRAGDLDALKAHVEGGWVPTLETDNNGSTALLWAAGGGHVECVKYLVNECGMNASAGARARRGYAGRTALHWAARNGHAKTVEWLVSQEAKVDVNVLTDEGTTAFCLACWQGQREVCEVLVKLGADPHLKNSFGCGAALWAVQGGCDVTFLRFLYEDLKVVFNCLNNNKHSALHKAAQRGLTDVCEWLVNTVGLKNREYFQQSHDEKSTPATLARFSGNEKLAEWLSTFES